MTMGQQVAATSARAAALAVAALVASPGSQAGRPVYTDYTLEALVREADVIAVVTPPAQHERTVRDSLGCPRVLWRLRLDEVLQQRPQAGRPAVAPAREVEVLVNPTYVRDCTLRKELSSSGASFMAQRYSPSGATATVGPHGAPAGPRFLVFLVAQGGALQLAADGAWESLDRQPEVRRWIGQAAGTAR